MSIRISIATEIPATPETVWAAIEDLSTHTAWMADAEEITFVSEQRSGVGTQFDCLTVVGPLRTTDRMTVTEWEPGSAMGILHEGAVTGRGRFTLAPSPRGTAFTWSEELRFPWWLGGPLGEAAGKPVLTWIWRRNLDRLRAHVVGGAP
jgi:hypothetical protein